MGAICEPPRPSAIVEDMLPGETRFLWQLQVLNGDSVQWENLPDNIVFPMERELARFARAKQRLTTLIEDSGTEIERVKHQAALDKVLAAPIRAIIINRITKDEITYKTFLKHSTNAEDGTRTNLAINANVMK